MKRTTNHLALGQLLLAILLSIFSLSASAADHRPVGRGEHGMTYGASQTEYNGQHWIFFQSKDHGGRINYRFKTDDGWSRQYEVPGVKLTYSPTVATYNNKIYLFHSGYDSKLICAMEFDGNKWGNEYKITEKRIQSSPVAVVYKGKLYVFFNGEDNIFYKDFDGKNWSSAHKLSAKGKHRPSPVVYQDQLYLFHCDHSDKGKLYYTKFDGKNWSSDTYAGDILLMDYSPSPVVYNNKIYIPHKGHSNKTIWYTIFDGKSFTKDKAIDHTSCTYSPEAFVMDGKIHMVHQYGDGGLIKDVTLDQDGSYSRDLFLIGFNMEAQGFLDKKFGTFTMPATHNSAISPPEFINGNNNTSHKAPLQLEQGVRLIELDFNYADFPFNVDLDRSVGIIHGKVYGSSAFGQRKPKYVLGEIRDWLDKNPNEVILIKIDSPSHVKDSDLKYFFEKAGLYNRIYIDKRDWTQATPRDVLKAGKQIIVFGATDVLKSNFYNDYVKWGGGKEEIKDLNPYLGTDSKPFGGPVAYATEGPMGFGSRSKAKVINEEDFLKPFALDSWRRSGKRPVFLTVDFSTYGEFMEVVYDLNHNYNAISGNVKDSNGNTLKEVSWEVSYSSDGKSISTKTYGAYNFPVRKGETVTITPKGDGITFNPSSYTYTNSGQMDMEINFESAVKSTLKSKEGALDQKENTINVAQVFPNPFAEQATFEFNLQQASSASLFVYNLSGKLVEEVDFGEMPEGNQRVIYQPKEKLVKGVYLYEIKAQTNSFAGKFMVQ